MDDYRKRKTVFEVPIKRARPVVEAQYDSVVHESRGVSPASVVALVLAAVAAAVAITLLIVNYRQTNTDQGLGQDRNMAQQAQQPAQQPQQPAPQQPAQQPAQQAPVIVTPPAAQPATGPVAPLGSGPSNAEIAAAISSKLLEDPDLASIEARVTDGTVTLVGRVPDDELKVRAEEIARSVKGVRRVVNRITVQSE